MLRATLVNAPSSLLEETKQHVAKTKALSEETDYEAQINALKEEKRKIQLEEDQKRESREKEVTSVGDMGTAMVSSAEVLPFL